jgi:hypothetical protein
LAGGKPEGFRCGYAVRNVRASRYFEVQGGKASFRGIRLSNIPSERMPLSTAALSEEWTSRAEPAQNAATQSTVNHLQDER